MIDIIVLSLAVSAFAILVSKAHVTKKLRVAVREKNATVAEIIECHHCLTHWLALVFTTIYQPIAVSVFYPLDLLVSAAAIVTLSALLNLAVVRLFQA